MTEQSTSGQDSKLHDNRNLDAHLGAKVEADSSEGRWEGQEIEVKSDPIIDPGTGKTVVLRVFEYSIDPSMPVKVRPTNQDLFNSHAMQIKHFLWKDGLRPFDEGQGLEPKVQFSKRERKYRIIVPCEARFGQSFHERAQLLPTHTT